MAILAIKGHSTRSKEVLELLKMMGGKNFDYFTCDYPNKFYYVLDGYIHWDYINPEEINKYVIFTLEDFLEKYPYKVGDKVEYDYWPCVIQEMCWDNEFKEIRYTVKGIDFCKYCSASDLKPFKEETMEEPKELLIGFIKDKGGNWVLNTHKDYEIKEVDGKFMLLRKKPQYLKTYEECCKILNMSRDYTCHNNVGYKWELITNFQKLLICRDAYWKIAGEGMGLGKPWEPDWSNAAQRKYCIVNTEGNVLKWVQKTTNKILAFPTKEMCDAFYENFKDLIEKCKEFL